MKTKLVILALVGLFVASCSSKKAVVASIPQATTREVVLSPELIVGKTVYENSCVKCHQLHSPKEFTQEEWNPILLKMQKKAHLDDAQIASISNYISSQL